MSTKQHDRSKADRRDIERDDRASEERHRQVKTPDKGGEHPPGMGEDESKNYVPERERP